MNWYEILHDLRHAVADRLEREETGLPNRVCIVPGGGAAWDECDCGQLALFITRNYASNSFPNQAGFTLEPACTTYDVAEVTVQVVRCVPSQTDDGPPTCDALDEATRLQEVDAYAVRDAARCHLDAVVRTQTTPLTDWFIRDQTRIGPEGGCAGSELHLVIGVIDPCSCD